MSWTGWIALAAAAAAAVFWILHRCGDAFRKIEDKRRDYELDW